MRFDYLFFQLYLKGTNVNQNMGRHCKEIQWKRVELSIIFTKNMFCIFSFLIIAIIIYRELSSSLSRISGRCMWMPSPSSYDAFGNMVRYSLYRIALEEFYFNHKKRSLHVNSENSEYPMWRIKIIETLKILNILWILIHLSRPRVELPTYNVSVCIHSALIRSVTCIS